MADDPVPMIPIKEDPSPESSVINRLTLRYLSIRERGGEQYQDFPQNEYVGCEVHVSHKQAAYVIPDMEAGKEPLKLNLGWIDSPRLVVILNRTVWKGAAKPTRQQQQAIAECVLLVGFSNSSFPILLEPRQQQPLLLSPDTDLYIKAKSGIPIVSIFAV